jgi:putative tryptophan/tyrosine transport system substrate-binding protein
MRRRELMLLLGAAMITAPALRAQQKAMPVIGFLGNASPVPFAPFMAAFHQGLNETGYIEGQNVGIEYRWAEGHYDRLPALAADLVSRKVDVIATRGGSASALAAKNATSTIPIVFETGADPVELGLVSSFARPGGNLTGVTILTAELMPKRLELLSELVPQAGVIALLVNPNSPVAERVIRDVQEGARARGAAPYPEGRRRGRIRDRLRFPRPTPGRRASGRQRPILFQSGRSARGARGTSRRAGDV